MQSTKDEQAAPSTNRPSGSSCKGLAACRPVAAVGAAGAAGAQSKPTGPASKALDAARRAAPPSGLRSQDIVGDAAPPFRAVLEVVMPLRLPWSREEPAPATAAEPAARRRSCEASPSRSCTVFCSSSGPRRVVASEIETPSMLAIPV
jgi:hypothetical protein